MVDMQVIVRRQDQKLCASITCMIRHYVARRAKVIFDHPHNAAFCASISLGGSSPGFLAPAHRAKSLARRFGYPVPGSHEPSGARLQPRLSRWQQAMSVQRATASAGAAVARRRVGWDTVPS